MWCDSIFILVRFLSLPRLPTTLSLCHLEHPLKPLGMWYPLTPHTDPLLGKIELNGSYRGPNGVYLLAL